MHLHWCFQLTVLHGQLAAKVLLDDAEYQQVLFCSLDQLKCVPSCITDSSWMQTYRVYRREICFPIVKTILNEKIIPACSNPWKSISAVTFVTHLTLNHKKAVRSRRTPPTFCINSFLASWAGWNRIASRCLSPFTCLLDGMESGPWCFKVLCIPLEWCSKWSLVLCASVSRMHATAW